MIIFNIKYSNVNNGFQSSCTGLKWSNVSAPWTVPKLCHNLSAVTKD